MAEDTHDKVTRLEVQVASLKEHIDQLRDQISEMLKESRMVMRIAIINLALLLVGMASYIGTTLLSKHTF